jgi:hypothetical protein
MSNFTGARTKLTIGSLEDPDLVVTAQYNPKELPVSKSVLWNDHDMVAEYGGRKGRELTVELFFDAYEQQQSVMTELLKLDQLSSPQDWSSRVQSERRPHRCIIVWGDKMERLPCVITGIDTKFVMWNDDGMPVRAIATVKLMEVDVRAMARAEAPKANRYAAQPGIVRVS